MWVFGAPRRRGARGAPRRSTKRPAGGGDGRTRERKRERERAQVAAARQLAQRLLRLVRGATTSATPVRGRLRDVDLRAAAALELARDDVAGRARIRQGDARRAFNMSAAEAAAASDFGRVRALSWRARWRNRMAPREANRASHGKNATVARRMGGVTVQLATPTCTPSRRIARRGAGRTASDADAGGADLAHKLASVVEVQFRGPPRRRGASSAEATAPLPQILPDCGENARRKRDDATRTRDSTRSNTPSRGQLVRCGCLVLQTLSLDDKNVPHLLKVHRAVAPQKEPRGPSVSGVRVAFLH